MKKLAAIIISLLVPLFLFALAVVGIITRTFHNYVIKPIFGRLL